LTECLLFAVCQLQTVADLWSYGSTLHRKDSLACPFFPQSPKVWWAYHVGRLLGCPRKDEDDLPARGRIENLVSNYRLEPSVQMSSSICQSGNGGNHPRLGRLGALWKGLGDGSWSCGREASEKGYCCNFHLELFHNTAV
jgi:hypothetical protein